MLNSLFDSFLYRDQQEILETKDIPIEERYKILDKLGKVLKRLGYNKIFLSYLGKLAGKQKPETLTICEIGPGSGMMLKAVHQWAKKNNITVELSGIELDADFARITQENLKKEGIPVVIHAADATDVNFLPAGHFDLVYCNNMVHHVRSKEKVKSLFTEMDRISKKGWMVIDLDRRLSGLFFMYAGYLVGATKLLVTDGVRSVRRAYKANEIQDILSQTSEDTEILNQKCKKGKIVPYWWIFAPKKN